MGTQIVSFSLATPVALHFTPVSRQTFGLALLRGLQAEDLLTFCLIKIALTHKCVQIHDTFLVGVCSLLGVASYANLIRQACSSESLLLVVASSADLIRYSLDTNCLRLYCQSNNPVIKCPLYCSIASSHA